MRSFLLVCLILLPAIGDAQVRSRVKPPETNSLLDNKAVKPPKQVQEVREVFAAVEQGILNGTVARFSAHFGKQVSMTISGSESGFVSASQAASILQNFLSSRKPTQFAFTRWNDTTASPFATGRMAFNYRGSKESVQVYVSLTHRDAGWVISKFNIY